MDVSWTIKKAEHQRFDAFELWCWRRLLRVPWTARRSNHSILKEISPGLVFFGRTDWWSWNSNTLATWCKELTHLKRPWCWERLRAGGEGDNREWDDWMASPTQWTWVWVNSGSWWWTGKPGVLRFMGLQRVRYDWATELNWKRHFYKELIHTITDTGVSQDLQSELASWRTRRPNGLVLIKKLPGWRTRRSQYSTQIWKQEKSSDPVQFSCSIVSDSLQPHGLQHTRLPCPSPTLGANSNSCPLSWWCHPTISSSVIPSPPAFNLSQY